MSDALKGIWTLIIASFVFLLVFLFINPLLRAAVDLQIQNDLIRAGISLFFAASYVGSSKG